MIVVKKLVNLQDHNDLIILRAPRPLLRRIKKITQQIKIEAKALILLKDMLEG